MTYGIIKRRSSAVTPLRRSQSRTLAQAVAFYNIPRAEVSKFLRKYALIFQRELRTQAQNELAANAENTSIRDIAAFLGSLRVRVDTATMDVQITSNFPFMQRLLDGSPPYPMDWLTQENGVDVVPMENEEGELIFRTAPLTSAEAWIHPGIAKHEFLQKAMDRARRKGLVMIKEFAAQFILPRIIDPGRK